MKVEKYYEHTQPKVGHRHINFIVLTTGPRTKPTDRCYQQNMSHPSCHIAWTNMT